MVSESNKKKIAIYGGGAAALFCAAYLDRDRYDVVIYEKTKSPGRKFLVAGNGGFNLTHGESTDEMLNRYIPKDFMQSYISSYTNEDLRAFLVDIGIHTYVGTSNRVFPKRGTKPIQVLQAILDLLNNKGFKINTLSPWNEFNPHHQNVDSNVSSPEDITIFALGGASWAKTGSDGNWLSTFQDAGIQTVPFIATNCAFHVAWPPSIINHHEGKPLKNIHLIINSQVEKGELVITQDGLEGNAIYALSPILQSYIQKGTQPEVLLDLKPHLTHEDIATKWNKSNRQNVSKFLKTELKFTSQMIALLKAYTTKDEYQSKSRLIDKIKALEIPLIRPAPIDEAISTMGGISVAALHPHLELKDMPNHFCIGEMIDWFAPTGGYLLQGCISMGVYVARYLNAKH